MRRPVLIGLTGSIGMGKSTTAAMLEESGVPVWDADAAVHRLYAKGGAAVAPMAALHPEAIRDGAVDRDALKAWIARDNKALAEIETVVHPLVAADRQDFIARSTAPLLAFDIPLLFETGGDATMDVTIVVSAPLDIQRARVLARPGMTEDRFQTILARQLPDAEKRARADYVISTVTIEDARARLDEVLEAIKDTYLNA